MARCCDDDAAAVADFMGAGGLVGLRNCRCDYAAR